MLEVNKVCFSYESMEMEFNLSVQTGECIALIGPSGAGKSTLLSLLAGFEKPIQGSIKFDGKELTGLSPAERPITSVFQEYNLFSHLEVVANVGLGIHPGLKLSSADRDKINHALKQVGLRGMERRKPGELSGGQRQRVALARALVREKPLLLLDEPFAALGPALRQEMLVLLDRLRIRSNMTILLVSHHPADARQIASRTAFVHNGIIKAFDDTSSLLTAEQPEVLQKYLGDANIT